MIGDEKVGLECKGIYDTKESKSFSSNTRMGEMKIKVWKEKVKGIIFSVFETSSDESEHWFLSHSDMQEWYDIKVIAKQQYGHAGRVGLKDWQKARLVLESLNWQGLEKFDKTIQFGSRLNDPQISLKYVKEHGTKMDNNRLPGHLRELLAELI